MLKLRHVCTRGFEIILLSARQKVVQKINQHLRLVSRFRSDSIFCIFEKMGSKLSQGHSGTYATAFYSVCVHSFSVEKSVALTFLPNLRRFLAQLVTSFSFASLHHLQQTLQPSNHQRSPAVRGTSSPSCGVSWARRPVAAVGAPPPVEAPGRCRERCICPGPCG